VGKILIASTVIWALAGCASTDVQVADAGAQTCTRDVPVGTLIPVTRCRSAEQMAREAEAARDAMSRPMPVLGAGGGSR
jgi:hypothetical protein